MLRIVSRTSNAPTRSVTLGERRPGRRSCWPPWRALLVESHPLIAERGLTLVGVALTNLDKKRRALALPFEPDTGPAVTETDGVRLDTALDAVRAKFGSVAVTRAALLGRDRGLRPDAARRVTAVRRPSGFGGGVQLLECAGRLQVLLHPPLDDRPTSSRPW